MVVDSEGGTRPSHVAAADDEDEDESALTLTLTPLPPPLPATPIVAAKGSSPTAPAVA